MAPIRSTRSRANRTKEYRTSGRRPSRNPFILFRSDVAKTNWRVSIPNASSVLWKEMTEEEKFLWRTYAERAHLDDPSKEESQIFRLQSLEGIKNRVWAKEDEDEEAENKVWAREEEEEEEEVESRVEGIEGRPEDSTQSPDCPSTAASPIHNWGAYSAETSRCSSEDAVSNMSTTTATTPRSTTPWEAFDVPPDALEGAHLLVPSPSTCSFSHSQPRLPDPQFGYCDSTNTYPFAINFESTLDTLLDPSLDIPSLANQNDFSTFGQVEPTLQPEEIPELSLPEFQDPDPLNHQLYASIDKISDEEVKYWADYFYSMNTAQNSDTKFEPAAQAHAQGQAEDFDLSTVDWSTIDCSAVDWKYIQETFPDAYDTVFGEPYISNAEELDYDCSTSDLEQGYDSW